MRTALLLASLCFAACTSDDGTAPMISGLTFSPMSFPVGVQSTVSGNMTFADPDGDLDQIGIEIELPDRSTQLLPMSDVQNVGSMTEGTLAWALIVAPPAAGTYRLSLWLTDIDGHESNHLDAIVSAQ